MAILMIQHVPHNPFPVRNRRCHFPSILARVNGVYFGFNSRDLLDVFSGPRKRLWTAWSTAYVMMLLSIMLVRTWRCGAIMGSLCHPLSGVSEIALHLRRIGLLYRLLKKLQKETLEEYTARVRRLVNKAYPGIVGKPLLEDIAVEHLVNGLSDHNLIYDVMTKKPSTVEAALDLIQWHENCRSIQRKKTGIRQLKTEQDSKKTDWVSARWMGNRLWLKSA